jgi:hypothetical protein
MHHKGRKEKEKKGNIIEIPWAQYLIRDAFQQWRFLFQHILYKAMMCLGG